MLNRPVEGITTLMWLIAAGCSQIWNSNRSRGNAPLGKCELFFALKAELSVHTYRIESATYSLSSICWGYKYQGHKNHRYRQQMRLFYPSEFKSVIKIYRLFQDLRFAKVDPKIINTLNPNYVERVNVISFDHIMFR